MATTIESTQLTEGPRIRLDGISWDVYDALAREVGPRPALRMTYDNGALELMTISPQHDWLKELIGQLIEMLSWEYNIQRRSGGSFTHKRKDLLKGIEPDACYWIQNATVIGNKVEFDFRYDPPPDLAVEVDITSSSVSREAIYAALGVRELWRCNGKRIQALELQSTGKYVVRDESIAFPGLPVSELMKFIDLSDTRGELARLKAFVAWLRTLDLAAE